MKTICVYCSASNAVDKIYFDSAKEMGELIGKNGYNLVYGGSNLGLMGAVASAAHKNGSHVTGVIPEKLYEFINREMGDCDKSILVKDMRERKDKMDELSDAIIVLAGGFGTVDEIAEMIELKILGYHTKPIVFLNSNHFYDDLMKFFKHITEEKFARCEALDLFKCAYSAQEVIEYFKNYKPNLKPRTPDDIYVSKIN